MKTAFITRSTLFDVPGGDTVQVVQTARYLRELGHEVDICLTSDTINYANYEILHFSNIIRPADILFHLSKTKAPAVLSPILIDYSEFDRNYRKGISGLVLRLFPANTNEYIKTLSRWITGKDALRTKSYLWLGQKRSIRKVLEKTAILLPNSEAEYKKLTKLYKRKVPYKVVPNGVDPSLFTIDNNFVKDSKLVLCAARIEGIKNQLNLIKALNGTAYTLMLIGSPAPNQKKYYEECRKIAAKNIIFHQRLPQEKLVEQYRAAKVHALPSWYESCGLSSLEAAVLGCNVVISDKGFTREYFGDDGFYADPGNPDSIYHAVDQASKSNLREKLQQKIVDQYTWKQAAVITAEAYANILNN